MRPIWPDDTDFHRLVLDVESDFCELCGKVLHICDHRFHRFHTLQGPMELVCRLAHCSDRTCPARCHTLSPAAEMSLTLPRCLVGWDVFCWMGHRRFRQHWSVPQLQDELQQSYHIQLSRDTLVNYLRRYQNLLAARQQDPVQMAEAYRGIKSLVLTIDGLQPEKGHETLYVVREINAKRIWFGEALLSSSTDEIRSLFVRAHEIVERLGLPVKLWLSDKQDAFVKGIAAEFADAPHRYCQNHFLRDLAKPTLAKDSSAKVQMRKKVRGLRTIEREVLEQRRDRVTHEQQQSPSQDEGQQETASASAQVTVRAPVGGAGGTSSAEVAGQPTAPTPLPCCAASKQTPADNDASEQVVLDYCAAVRGILNDDQGGPLHPPGVRMAEALREVQESLERNLELNKPGPAHGQLERLAGLIDSGLASVKQEQAEVQQEVADGAVDGELDGRAVFGAPCQERGKGASGQPGTGEMVPQAEEARAANPRPTACGDAYRAGRADPGPRTRRPRCAPWTVYSGRAGALLVGRGTAGATRSHPAPEGHAQGTLQKKRKILLGELERKYRA